MKKLFSKSLFIGLSCILASSYALADDSTIITLFNQAGRAKVTEVYLKINLPNGQECLATPLHIPATPPKTTITQSQLQSFCQDKQDFIVWLRGNVAPDFRYSSPAKKGAICLAAHNFSKWPLTTIDVVCNP